MLLTRLLTLAVGGSDHAVIDARSNLSGVCGRCYPAVLDLHGFFIAISRTVVNHDGTDDTAPDPLVWSAGALPEKRWLVHAVRDLAMLPGASAIWGSGWFNVPASVISADDIAHWPYSVSRLDKWVAFLDSLHCLLAVLILGLVVFLMLRCSFFMSFGLVRGLAFQKAHPRYLRPGRPISVSAVPFGPGIDIWWSWASHWAAGK